MDLPRPEHPGEPIVLDGSNIAHRAGIRNGGFQTLLDVEQGLIDAGWEVIVVVDASLRHRIGDEADILEDRLDAGWIQVPKGTDADEAILAEADRLDAWVLSGDRYQDHARPPRRRLDPALVL